MRKLLIAGVVVLLIIGLLLWRGPKWLDSLAGSQVRQLGTRTLGVDVEADHVQVSPVRGEVEITGLTIANPEGFTPGPFVEIDHLYIRADLFSLLSDQAHIFEIQGRSVRLWIERKGLRLNYQPILERLRRPRQVSRAALGLGGASSVLIDEIVLEDVIARVSLLESLRPMTLKIGPVEVRDVDSKNGSAALLQILEQLLESARGGQASSAGGGSLLQRLLGSRPPATREKGGETERD